jgi:hypothetical protein
MEGSGSIQIITDPDADPKGPKTYGSGSGTLAGTGSRRAKITHKINKNL